MSQSCAVNAITDCAAIQIHCSLCSLLDRFCFVEFESEDLKNAAYESREGKELCDRPIFIDTLGGKPRGGGRSSFGGGGGRSSFGGGRRGGRDSRGGGKKN